MKNFLKIGLMIAVFFTAFGAHASEEDFFTNREEWQRKNS